MAKPKTAEQSIEEIALANSETSPGSITVEAQVLAEFNQADDQDLWTVTVARWIKYGSPEEFCFECAPTDFPIVAKIQEQFGAGTYIVRARRNGKIVRAFKYAIAAPREKPADKVTSEMGAVAQAFTSALERQGAQIERLAEQMRTAPQREPQSLTELVTALASLKDLMPAPREPVLNAETLLSVFKMGVELAGERGGGDKPGGLMGMLERLIDSPLFGKLLEGPAAAQPATAPAPRPVIPGPLQHSGEGDAARPQPTADQQAQQQAALENFMRQQIMYLMGRAHQWQTSGQTRSHPELYAEWTIDNIPEEILRPIIALPDPFAALLVYVPEAAAHRAWFTDLISDVAAELTAEGGPDDIAGRPNGAAPQHVPSPPGPDTRANT